MHRMVTRHGRTRKALAASGLAVVIGVFGIVALFAGLIGTKTALAEPVFGIGKDALDGQTIRLSDGRVVRLESIQAPFLSSDETRRRSWPLADQAKRALDALIKDQALTITTAREPLDRYGRLVGQVRRADAVWLNMEMIALGLARVETTKETNAEAQKLLAREQQARTAELGIWGLDFYAIQDPRDLQRLIGTFQIVEGVVLDASRIKGRIFLNFGQNWRTDFTAMIPPKARAAMEKRDFVPLALKGRSIRVRGWLGSRNGPVIEVDHLEQIEVLDRR